MSKKLCLLVVVLLCQALPAVADADAALAAAQARYPATDVRAAKLTPILGVYEFDMGGETVYGDVSSRYLILGRLIDMEASSAPPIDYAAIVTVAVDLQPGAQHGEVILFSDPQCPYCAALERRMVAGELEGFRVRLIFAPILQGSEAIVDSLLCLADPGAAYRDLMLVGLAPPKCASGQLAQHLAAVATTGITATPSFLAPSGAVYVGLPAEAVLRDWLFAQQQR